MSRVGTSLTKQNVRYMLEQSNNIEDVFDITSLYDAERAWRYIEAADVLTIDIILETHKILMQHQLIEAKYKGYIRDVPVIIGAEYKALPKIVLKALLEDFCTDVNNAVEHGYQDAIIHHLQFENIHAFYDGNGRLGRILMNWESVKTNGNLIVFENVTKYNKYYPLFK